MRVYLRFKAIRDLSDVVKVLCAVGFTVRWVDAAASSDVTPTGAGEREPICGCRVVVTCTKSGLRAVLETSREECTCSVQQLHVAAGSQVIFCAPVTTTSRIVLL